ncbi:MAG: hypothetical protein HYZ46_03275 [Nitrosomonadales bacterium]|nr:hypothetical protein [Nitrosomonadales bacterium]
MRARYPVLLLAAFTLVGCDRITGADKKKILDAEAIGYACRVSLKAPEDCMKENDTHSPTHLLNGWKEADKDISNQVLDPTMGKKAAPTAAGPAPAAPVAATPPAAVPPGKAAADKNAKPKNEKAVTAKPTKGEAEKKASH